MKILHVADLHYSLKHYDWLLKIADRYDVVVIAGDLLDIVSPVNQPTQILVVQKYIKRLVAQTKLIVSSGNHDGNSRNDGDESRAEWLARSRSSGAYVDGECLDLDGTLFTICPWWDGPISRAQVNNQLENDAHKPKSRWIWVHHAPPQDSPTSWTRKGHFGDDNLHAKIEEYQPDFVLSGHIHQAPFNAGGSWIDQIGKTWVIQNGKAIGDFPAHAVLDLDANVVAWISPYDTGQVDLTKPLAGQLSPVT
ncbi:MAG: metallophosphoesterase [Verrucomicrobiota bacterium]